MTECAARPTGAELALHVPQVVPLTGVGRWGVICAACSREVGDYVERCRWGWPDDGSVPPPVLYESDGGST